MDIFQAAGYIIQTVFALPAAVKFTGNGYRSKFSGQQVTRIFEGQGHLGHTTGSTAARPVEDQIFQVIRTQGFYFMLSDHPADSIYDIRFSATVRTYNPCYRIIQYDLGFIGK
ncbi:hypothetical protein D3C86_1080930 [compost metagenome]